MVSRLKKWLYKGLESGPVQKGICFISGILDVGEAQLYHYEMKYRVKITK